MINTSLNAQFTNMNWALGDSCGIHFSSTGVDSLYQTAVNARGSCAAISDSAGKLLFYAASPDLELYNMPLLIENGRIYNKQHQTMENGDTISCSNWYHEMMILPWPDSLQKFAVIHSMATSGARISYSVVDMSYNNGLGKVVTKNNVLSYGNICDGMTAIRHGNGRDWWILFRKWWATTNFFYKILLTPQGFSGVTTQQIGKPVNSSNYSLVAALDGENIIGIGGIGDSVIERFSFDRCTGVLSNHQIIYNGDNQPVVVCWEGALSASGRFLYLSSFWTPPSMLYQIDLQDSLAWNHKVVIDSIDTLTTVSAALRLAPNGKIYRSDWWCESLMQCYPFADTAYSPLNTHLSVINEPDSAGLACNYTGLSQHLGGYRTYLGLPNCVNLSLGAKTGSACDTLSIGITEPPEAIPLKVYPNPAQQVVTVELPFKPTANGVIYQLTDPLGRIVKEGLFKYVSNELWLNNLPSGLYFLHITTNKMKYQARLIRNK